jgi:hypothetical protein
MVRAMSKSTLEKIVGQDGPVLQRLFADNIRRFAGRYLLAFVLMAVVAAG